MFFCPFQVLTVSALVRIYFCSQFVSIIGRCATFTLVLLLLLLSLFVADSPHLSHSGAAFVDGPSSGVFNCDQIVSLCECPSFLLVLSR
jgi:hypothetical protein